jgi:hypothetical protein
VPGSIRSSVRPKTLRAISWDVGPRRSGREGCSRVTNRVYPLRDELFGVLEEVQCRDVGQTIYWKQIWIVKASPMIVPPKAIPKSARAKLVSENVRLSHLLCNNRDHGWKSMIGTMLEHGMSLDQIADRLNRRKEPRPRSSDVHGRSRA